MTMAQCSIGGCVARSLVPLRDALRRPCVFAGRGRSKPRRKWIENRLEELADIFAVAAGGDSVLDNHLHVHPAARSQLRQKRGRMRSQRDVGQTALSSTSRLKIPPTNTRHRALGSMAAVRHSVDRDQAPAAAKPGSWFMKLCLIEEPLSRLDSNRQACCKTFRWGVMSSTRRLHRATLSPGQGFDLRRAGRDIRAARL